MRLFICAVLCTLILRNTFAQNIQVDSLVKLDRIAAAVKYLSTKSSQTKKYSIGRYTIQEFPELGIKLKSSNDNSYFDLVTINADGKSSLYGLNIRPSTSFKDALRVFKHSMSVKVFVGSNTGYNELILSGSREFDFRLKFKTAQKIKNNIITDFTVDSLNYSQYYDSKLISLECESAVISIPMATPQNTASAWDNSAQYRDRLNYAWTLFKEKKYEESLVDFAQLKTDYPKNSSAHYFEGYSYTRLGYLTKAIESYERSMKLPLDRYTDKFGPLLNVMELYLMTGQRLKIETMEKKVYEEGKSRERFLATFFALMSNKLANKQDVNREMALKDALKYVDLKKLNWSFDEITTWLNASTADATTKAYISDWVKKLTVD